MISFLLNLPYTFFGFLLALVSFPISCSAYRKPTAVVFLVKSFWWSFGYLKNAQGITFGHVIVLKKNAKKWVLEHELVHVRQGARLPLVFPFLYLFELCIHGYLKNKYEIEAYKEAHS